VETGELHCGKEHLLAPQDHPVVVLCPSSMGLLSVLPSHDAPLSVSLLTLHLFSLDEFVNQSLQPPLQVL